MPQFPVSDATTVTKGYRRVTVPYDLTVSSGYLDIPRLTERQKLISGYSRRRVIVQANSTRGRWIPSRP